MKIDLTQEDVEHLKQVLGECGEWKDRRILDKLPQETYSIGDRFKQEGGPLDGSKYILASVGGDQVALIDLERGNLWTKSHPVKDKRNITQDEFNRIANDPDFVKI